MLTNQSTYMYIQITNRTLTSNNMITIETTAGDAPRQTLIAIKNRRWNTCDCNSKQIDDALITRKYRGVDGKNIPAGTRQYKSRARYQGTLNVKKNKAIPETKTA